VSLRYLLDSNSLSEPMRRRPNPKFMEKLQRFQGRIATASTVWSELWFGHKGLPESPRKHAIGEYLRSLELSTPILPFEKAAAEWVAEERFRLASMGRVAPISDAQIAAVAFVHGLTVVTDNLKHFKIFSNVEVESWMS
jgi:tRNA(fMet)-specific endonuclease VapC